MKSLLLPAFALLLMACGSSYPGQHCQTGANGTQCYNDQYATQGQRQQPDGARPEGYKPGSPMPAR